MKVTTTTAVYRGIAIKVLSDKRDRKTVYSCTNNSGRPKVAEKWFDTQSEALANERREIDAALPG